MNRGDVVNVTDIHGDVHQRTIKSIHYPSSINGLDCVIIYLDPVPE